MNEHVWPKVHVWCTANGMRGWCRGCETLAVIVDEACAKGFKQRHERCREDGKR